MEGRGKAGKGGRERCLCFIYWFVGLYVFTVDI